VIATVSGFFPTWIAGLRMLVAVLIGVTVAEK